MHQLRSIVTMALAGLLVALATAAPAAADPPTFTNVRATAIQPGEVTLRGTVDPNGERTTWYFEYGTTRDYGSRTVLAGPLDGDRGVGVAQTVTGLNSGTRYHFRLVASNPSGVRSSADRTFTTERIPLAIELAAVPNPVTVGRPAQLDGRLTGTGAGGREVVLQQRTFPFTASFGQVGNPLVTHPDGTFTFPLLAVNIPVSTQYQVQVAGRPDLTSPIVTLGVALRVRSRVSAARVRRGRVVRVSGRVSRARPGTPFAIQRRKADGSWVFVVGARTRGRRGSTSSTFSRRIRVRRTTRYRVFVQSLDGNYVAGVGPTHRVRVRRR